MTERIQPRRRTHLATAVVLLGLCGATVYATRPAPAPEGLPDPATMRLDYRPGAYFPPEFPLHGEVRLLSSPIVEMGKRTRVKIEYTVGDMAIEEGMSIEIFKHFTSDVEQFQVAGPEAPAYLGAETTAAGVELQTRMYTNYSLRNDNGVFPYRRTADVIVTKGRLSEGNKVIFDLGGPKGVRMQYYSENLFNFRIVIVRAADGKILGYGGDAIMKVIGGTLEKLRVQAPSIVGLGENFDVEVVPQDGWGSLARNAQGLKLSFASGGVAGSAFEYDPELLHYVARNVVANSPGVVRIDIQTEDGAFKGRGNPVWVERHPTRRVYYGDLHQHTYLHDGRGVYEELYLYARREGLLDFGALTPHQGPLSVTGPSYHLDGVTKPRDNWPELVRANKIMKGWKGFVPILGYEYSVGTAAGGHHNVFYKGDEAPTVMHLDPNNPRAPIAQMLETLKRVGTPSLVIPHVGGGPPDWEHPTDQRVERLYEIASVHGVFEESYQKHLEAGLRMAASASGDTHTVSFGNAYPGLIYTMTNPLTGVYATAKTRDEIWDGLDQRRTFAATGNQRILLDFSVNEEPMGGELARGEAVARIRSRVSGTAPLVRLDLLKNSKVIHSVYPSRNRGRLLRVKWGDNIYQRRTVRAMASGSVTASEGRLVLKQPLHLDVAFEHIRQQGDAIAWRTAATSNDREGFLADLSQVTGDSLHFEIEDPDLGPMSVEIPLETLNSDGHFAWRSLGNGSVEHSYMKKMGVEPAFFVECELVNGEGPMDFEFSYEDHTELAPGDYYYLRVEQLDTNLAWSSPVWAN